jgi:HEPN domain-containing protein
LHPDTQNWIEMSDYDLETARHMLQTGRYLYVVFMCHLALEKMLKAHDLIYLLRKGGLVGMPRQHLDFIGKINNASIPTRYPDDLRRALREYPEEVARDYLKQTEEALQWLRKHQNLQR